MGDVKSNYGSKESYFSILRDRNGWCFSITGLKTDERASPLDGVDLPGAGW